MHGNLRVRHPSHSPQDVVGCHTYWRFHCNEVYSIGLPQGDQVYNTKYNCWILSVNLEAIFLSDKSIPSLFKVNLSQLFLQVSNGCCLILIYIINYKRRHEVIGNVTWGHGKDNVAILKLQVAKIFWVTHLYIKLTMIS